ncbi:DNA repair exonuclease SbcCD ATPase subunit [Sedimentibacter acidaminivorans]|uniref:Nuclease SbcCD subunit C n=1 Tax=Sedimentibacter acidaminivorans TaxID=913099 RepID=A0ABS4GC72_9FIRM|nr:AAA family ATPase [Sedimentibacter acidaminivorans]MBP1925262.1 DNA repair exonuclease SbcCD ATPase subunit [Sedimentibacter acidaminivorans]
MNFTQLKMKNFMRYKGTNVLNFSCDQEKKVTVVLGDNTSGKTTIAQAFRWALYGVLIETKYDLKNEISILNNEILGEMGPNDYREVVVEIEMEHEDKKYNLLRKANFSRKYPKYIAKQEYEKLTMRIKEKDSGVTTLFDNAGDDNGKNKGKVDDIINELLPINLSRYFLFDGERWNEDKNKRNDIKESVYTIMGVSPIRLMKLHLNELGTYGKNGVIKQLRRRITGSGDDYNNLNDSLQNLLSKIDDSEKKIVEASKNKLYYEQKIADSEDILNANKTIELDQQKVKSLEKDIENSEKYMKSYYADIVTSFSKSYIFFAAPLLEEVISLLKNVELDGKDIPDITNDTIAYIINNGICICGHKVIKDSYEYDTLMKLKQVIPPMAIGTLVGNYQKELKRWHSSSSEIYKVIKDKADLYQGEKFSNEDNENEIEKINKRIDGKINFQQERLKMQSNKKNKQIEEDKIRKEENNIEDYKRKAKQLEEEISRLQDKSAKNAQIERNILIAEKVYEASSRIYKKNETTILNELNNIINNNFKVMFNEKDKYARLEDNYDIKLYYNKINEDDTYSEMEAHGLSEGEKIAKNFVFIVSIMELANLKKSDSECIAQTLPLVLDGPFSKLSSVNIELISQVLPKTADQVILFMLDKDWEHSKLEKYTGAKYIVAKEKEQNYSKIEKIY